MQVSWLARGRIAARDGLPGNLSSVGPGDSVEIGGERFTAFARYNDRPRQDWRSAQRLLGVEFTVVCDGHYGCTPDARSKLAATLRDAD